MNHAIAIFSRQVVLPHKDPADRFIVATAIYYGLTLATVDTNIIASSAVQTLIFQTDRKTIPSKLLPINRLGTTH
ncbi:hypothetical protein [Okeania sp. SIO2B3]|uniref:hypothetical protein n=1 Tax=Okeania sp. SIO2B3 TaxID=2607784 RepID=UPI0025FA3179|nr:hypothetical protein [Okeania sp. SIO2B3]